MYASVYVPLAWCFMGAWLSCHSKASVCLRLQSCVGGCAPRSKRTQTCAVDARRWNTRCRTLQRPPRHEVRIAFGLHAAQHDSRTTRSCPVRVHARKLITGPHRFARGGRRQRVATAAALIRQLVTSPLSRWYGCFQRERRRSQGGWQPVDQPRLGARGTCERSGGRA